jgi:hypothetical protein
MGPKKVSEAIAKLSVDKTEVDKDTGVATSAFDKFVDGLKQEAIESIMGTPPSTTSTDAPTAGATPEASGEEVPAENKSPAEKLPDLVQNKL